MKNCLLKYHVFTAACAFIFLSAFSTPACCENYKTVLHVHSDRSSGAQSLGQIAASAKAAGIDAVILSDTFVRDVEYGLMPFRNIVSHKVKKNALIRSDIDKFFKEAADLSRIPGNPLMMPGAEVAAYYRWSGNLWSGLTLNDWNRHILVFGLLKPADLENIPALGNKRNYKISAWAIGLLSGLCFCVYLAHKAGFARITLFLAVLTVVSAIDMWPFTSPRLTAYEKSTSYRPYSDLIRYVHEKGGFAFWAHPEAPNWSETIKISDKVGVKTLTYEDCLRGSGESDGFGVFMEGFKKMAVPGGEWDKSLEEYSKGSRKKPAWAVSELDYHCPGCNGTYIDSVYMNVQAGSRTPEALADAIGKGRFESVRDDARQGLRLLRWELSGKGGIAASGEILRGEQKPVIRIKVDVSAGDGNCVIMVIRGGKIIFNSSKPLPAEIVFRDDPPPHENTFYRVMLKGPGGSKLVSNPIFSFQD